MLRDLTFDISPGEMVGLIGASGAGKTTLINLICRFYDVKEGSVLADGVDIRSYPIEEYRKNIGIVLQEPFLFYGTIAENIAYGRPEASRPDIVAAARAARAHDFILRLPDGYDSIVGERGQFLSGGERQRISIARALLIDPRILILDEATSSVDNETEREIQAALENLIRGRTTVAIAHRLSTLRRATKLLVIEHGRLQKITTPEEVLPAPGEDEPESNRDYRELAAEELADRGFSLIRKDSGSLVLTDADGRAYHDVEVARAFPLTAPNERVSIMLPHGSEALCIRDLGAVDPDARALLEQALSLREFVPIIQRITHADTNSTPLEWHVVTNRGSTTFFVNSEEEIRRLSDTSALFVDTHGIRYLLPDFRVLDQQSRKILSRLF